MLAAGVRAPVRPARGRGAACRRPAGDGPAVPPREAIHGRAGKRLISAMPRSRVLVRRRRDARRVPVGRVARISPEAPVPVVEVTRPELPPGRRRQRGQQRARARRPGGAGGRHRADDVAGDKRARTRSCSRVSRIALALAEAGRPTTVKTRIVAHHQQVVRADRERTERPAGRGRGRAAASACAQALPSLPRGRRVRLPEGRGDGARHEDPARPGPAPGACRCWSTPRCGTSSATAAPRSSRPNQREAEQATGIAHPRRGGPARGRRRDPAAASTAGPRSSRAASTA